MSRNKRLMIVAVAAAVLLITFIVIGAAVYILSGRAFLIGRYVSPDGGRLASVYNSDFDYYRDRSGKLHRYFTGEPKVTLIISFSGAEGINIYDNSEFVDLHWSPDSDKLLVELDRIDDRENWIQQQLYGGRDFEVINFKSGMAKNVNAILEMGISRAEGRHLSDSELETVAVSFTGWENSDGMNFLYSYTDGDGLVRTGRFTFDLYNGFVSD